MTSYKLNGPSEEKEREKYHSNADINKAIWIWMNRHFITFPCVCLYQYPYFISWKHYCLNHFKVKYGTRIFSLAYRFHCVWMSVRFLFSTHKWLMTKCMDAMKINQKPINIWWNPLQFLDTIHKLGYSITHTLLFFHFLHLFHVVCELISFLKRWISSEKPSTLEKFKTWL